MDIKQLEYFMAIAETGHITAAAKKLNISQPPLSLQLKNLENELGAELFRRNSRNMEITPAGLMLRDRAKQLFELMDTIYADFETINATMNGTLNLGSIYCANADNFVMEKIRELSGRYPDIRFNLYGGSTTRVRELMEYGVITVGFIREALNPELYYGIRLTNCENRPRDYYVAVGDFAAFGMEPEGEVVALRELNGRPLVIHKVFLQQLNEVCAEHGIKANVTAKNNNDNLSLDWAASRMGIALMPVSAVNGYICQGNGLQVKTVVEPEIPAEIYLVWRKDRYLTNPERELVELFR